MKMKMKMKSGVSFALHRALPPRYRHPALHRRYVEIAVPDPLPGTVVLRLEPAFHIEYLSVLA